MAAALLNVGRRMMPSSPRAAWGLTRYATTAVDAAPEPTEGRSRTLKVADRLVRVHAIDPQGQRHLVIGLTGKTLLRALCNAGLIEPLSHRHEDLFACSAHCEVRIPPDWLSRLPPLTNSEIDVLEAAALRGEWDRHARLACQIILNPALEGMIVAVPEPRPWDIP